MSDEKKPIWIVGITGASGMPYALRLLDILEGVCEEVHVVFSEAAIRVLHEEQGVKIKPSRLAAEQLIERESRRMFFYDNKDIGAAIASGSFLTEGMVIVPCSMGTLGAVANGLCQNLIHRAADVVLKEGRRLVIVPRETPLSAIHLRNMLALSEMQTRIVPAMPGFYQRPKILEDIVDMMVMKILDQMGIHRELVPRWGRDRDEKKGRVLARSSELFSLYSPDQE
ncbi:MAG: UbiX family flavin prenyltransferase [Bdellovibrionales bacterium]|nr:UbiX family flavin prenyltransferase [Bdellovibrionales bacterium]